MKTIAVKYQGYDTVMNEDGEFRCPHPHATAVYEPGGDGVTEPRGGWLVDCSDCDNEDLTQPDAERILDDIEDFTNKNGGY